MKFGELAACEKCLVGEGYAGRTDLVQQLVRRLAAAKA